MDTRTDIPRQVITVYGTPERAAVYDSAPEAMSCHILTHRGAGSAIDTAEQLARRLARPGRAVTIEVHHQERPPRAYGLGQAYAGVQVAS